MDYERGLKAFKERARNADWLQDFLGQEARLRENLSQTRRYGNDETRRAERAQIVDCLNALALQHLGLNFNDLCQPAEPHAPRRPPVPADQPWHGGDEVIVQGQSYLLHDPVEETRAPDRSFVQRRAKAWQPQADRLVWLKQVRVLRPTPSAAQARNALSHEGRLLAQFERHPDFPRLLGLDATGEAVTIAFSFAPGLTLAETFGPLDRPLDAGRAHRLLRSLRPLCAMLTTLHRENRAHRHLTPQGIVLLEGRRDHAVLRDLGLAAQPRIPDEGPPLYRAPEQARRGSLTLPGPHTDVYQLGAVLYHLLTGQSPGLFLNRIEPPSTWNHSLPPELDVALLRALAQEPGERWPTLRDLCAALGRAADQLASQLRGEL